MKAMTKTFRAVSPVEPFRVVFLVDPGKVAMCQALGEQCMGVSANSAAAAIDDAVEVDQAGDAVAWTGAAVECGDMLTADDAGRVVPVPARFDGWAIGRALERSTSGDQLVRVRVSPQQLQWLPCSLN